MVSTVNLANYKIRHSTYLTHATHGRHWYIYIYATFSMCNLCTITAHIIALKIRKEPEQERQVEVKCGIHNRSIHKP
jgi:hypothetical protein